MISTFVWNELISANLEQDKQFYADMFGWTFEEKDPSGNGNIYTICKYNDKFVCGMMRSPVKINESYWLSYICVEDVSKSFTKAKDLGATEIVPVMNIPEVGKIAIVKDKTNALIGFFEPSMEAPKAA
ncbi:VOC family protein [Rickettsiales bacterium LUAb2]